jgi:outer membrane protein
MRAHSLLAARRPPSWILSIGLGLVVHAVVATVLPTLLPALLPTFLPAGWGGVAWGAADGGATTAGEPTAHAERLTLADAEQNALRHQPNMLRAAGQTEAAEGRVEEARSGYLPQVNASGVYQRTTGNFAQRPGVIPQSTATMATPTWTSTTYNFFNFGLSASQLIYDFNQTADRWRAAAASRNAARASQSEIETQTLLTVRRVYFQARAQRDLIEVAEETVRNQQKHLEQIQQFVRAGIRPDIDLATARTSLANARVQLVATTNNYEVAIAQLDQAMGLSTERQFELADSAMAGVAGEDDAGAALVDKALRARPELAAAAETRRAQALTVSSLRGGYGPSLSATAGATEVGTQIDHLVPNWFLGLSLNWAIFQGGLTRGQVREANGTLVSVTADEEALRLQVGVEVEQARLAIRAAKSSIAAAEEALASGKDQLRLAEARYATGLGSAVELSDAQVAYSNAAAQEVQARYSLASARAQLITALGQR